VRDCQPRRARAKAERLIVEEVGSEGLEVFAEVLVLVASLEAAGCLGGGSVKKFGGR